MHVFHALHITSDSRLNATRDSAYGHFHYCNSDSGGFCFEIMDASLKYLNTPLVMPCAVATGIHVI